jgi:hypothetical protein
MNNPAVTIDILGNSRGLNDELKKAAQNLGTWSAGVEKSSTTTDALQKSQKDLAASGLSDSLKGTADALAVYITKATQAVGAVSGLTQMQEQLAATGATQAINDASDSIDGLTDSSAGATGGTHDLIESHKNLIATGLADFMDRLGDSADENKEKLEKNAEVAGLVADAHTKIANSGASKVLQDIAAHLGMASDAAKVNANIPIKGMHWTPVGDYEDKPKAAVRDDKGRYSKVAGTGAKAADGADAVTNAHKKITNVALDEHLKKVSDAFKSLTKSEDENKKTADSSIKNFHDLIGEMLNTALEFYGAKEAIETLDRTLEKAGENQMWQKQMAANSDSLGEAQDKMEEVEKFSNQAKIFPIDQIEEAAKQLQNMGAGALISQNGFTLIGDAAAAVDPNQFLSIALALGRVSNAITTGDRIPYAVQEIINMGVVSKEARRQLDLMMAGGSSGAAIWNVIQEDLKRSAGTMNTMRNSWDGALQGMKNTLGEAMESAGTPLIEALAPAIDSAADLIRDIIPIATKLATYGAEFFGHVNNAIKGMREAVQSGQLGEYLKLSFEIGAKDAVNALAGVAKYFGQALQIVMDDMGTGSFGKGLVDVLTGAADSFIGAMMNWLEPFTFTLRAGMNAAADDLQLGILKALSYMPGQKKFADEKTAEIMSPENMARETPEGEKQHEIDQWRSQQKALVATNGDTANPKLDEAKNIWVEFQKNADQARKITQAPIPSQIVSDAAEAPTSKDGDAIIAQFQKSRYDNAAREQGLADRARKYFEGLLDGPRKAAQDAIDKIAAIDKATPTFVPTMDLPGVGKVTAEQFQAVGANKVTQGIGEMAKPFGSFADDISKVGYSSIPIENADAERAARAKLGKPIPDDDTPFGPAGPVDLKIPQMQRNIVGTGDSLTSIGGGGGIFVSGITDKIDSTNNLLGQIRDSINAHAEHPTGPMGTNIASGVLSAIGSGDSLSGVSASTDASTGLGSMNGENILGNYSKYLKGSAGIGGDMKDLNVLGSAPKFDVAPKLLQDTPALMNMSVGSPLLSQSHMQSISDGITDQMSGQLSNASMPSLPQPFTPEAAAQYALSNPAGTAVAARGVSASITGGDTSVGATGGSDSATLGVLQSMLNALNQIVTNTTNIGGGQITASLSR